MKFANTKKAMKKTVVFFPSCLGGSLNDALQKENLSGWEILRPKDAEQKYGAKAPRDETGKLCVRLYTDSPLTTTQVKAFASDFDETEILAKIYALHEDQNAEAYRSGQAGLLKKALKEDGMI